jgi:hypothetical protein
MGFKVMKFHAVLHLAQDIKMFGVPMVVDTGSNESHHKTTKIAAKLTQKDVQMFEHQTSDRLDDFQVLDLAVAEMNHCPLWAYFQGYEDNVESKPKQESTITKGTMLKVTDDPATQGLIFKVITRMKNKDSLRMDNDVLYYVNEVQKKLTTWMEYVPICAEHNRNGQIFRSHG